LAGEAGKFVFRALQETDKINRFEIERENDALRAFLKKDAPRFQLSNITKTYVAVETDDASKRVRSYISILNSEIAQEFANEEIRIEAERYSSYPAVKIARLATDRHFESKGLACGLIDLVAGIARSQIMPHAGCRFLILDANRAKIDFYKRRGFVLVDNADNKARQNPVMFMDLHRTAAATPAR
jgi:hypothetical protein